ncbi:protein kinase domain-containing protein [Anabaena sp. UHCC 0399]|uniref:protein kinase domain-containing protein n=1 Tax=Anabaena sp. UHCC 0399 TaxID=3110238 RepID=UPI002B21E937|nr:protein kinase [Anabaena sp. UHCC 0399]MEA5567616.1 protein kinase [Anabaena sp. UHCC 0399]
MKYCINPLCEARENLDDVENCLACGTPLLINGRIRLIQPLRELTENPYVRIEVFEVHDAGTRWDTVSRRRIMKVLKWGNAKNVELFERESQTLRLINHPCIPKSTIDDFFTFIPNNSPLKLRCLVMDKIEGENLQKWIQSNGRISQSLAIKWLKQLVEILDVVHQKEFFHRDIKPANIIVQPDGRMALVDFGAARRITDTYLAKLGVSGETSTSIENYEITAVVSPGYTPLEQINGKALPQSDFYALGRTFVYLITGKPLIQLPIDKKGHLIWRKAAPQIDKPFADFLDELMASFPGNRPATTQIILQRLETLPLRSKINRIINSQLFKISAAAVFCLTILGIYNALIPVRIDYLLNEGKKAQQENRFDDAQKKFRQAVSIKPDVAKLVSDFYFEQADRRNISLENAKKYYELAIKYNPQNDVAYNNLGLVCQGLRDFQCVDKSYAAVFKLKPNSWEAHYGLGNFYDDLGKYDLAEKQYRLAIQNSELALDAVSNLARIKNIQGEYDAAIETARLGLTKAKEPELKGALYKSIGWAKFEQKKYKKAKEYLEKAQKLDFQRTDTYCLLAKTQEALGEFDQAWVRWEVCLLTKSELPEVFKWRTEVLERIKLQKSRK